jgi:transcriptional regulator with XRE-family HTH domain
MGETVQGEFDVAAALAAFRRETGSTQAALAVACNVDQPTLSKLERGKLRATLPVARRISLAIGVPLAMLVGDARERSAA